MSTIALVPDVQVHPVTGVAFRSGDFCGRCLHYDPSEYVCRATRDQKLTAPEMSACSRYLPRGWLGRLYRYGMTHPRGATAVPFGLAIGLVLVIMRLAVLA